AVGGDAHRSPDVGADLEAGEPRGHGRGRTARRAAGDVVDVPGVAAAAEDVVERLDVTRPARRVRLAEDDRARLLEARDRGCVVRRHVIGELDRTTRRADPLGLDRVLDGDGQPVQGTDILPPGEGGIGRIGRGAGTIRIEGDDGVDRRVQTFDSIEVELEELAARDLAGPDGGRQLDRRPRRHVLVHQALLRVVPYSETVSETVSR